ncbi:hypothetical protein XBO1_1610006 [Xenorhabdus bovienii str. oregonense]|uniref:Ner winged helix-turn-helix DNA-binding domain-containing protein n=1 Tax=Xenorhabdus bovienii str. oregonense TaxID=1398202 RepID=A0A077P549_XENBV|nr:hypothetical protein XBO1_1610006 [Xenorhabdus bovienii str. oregonense]
MIQFIHITSPVLTTLSVFFIKRDSVHQHWQILLAVREWIIASYLEMHPSEIWPSHYFE